MTEYQTVKEIQDKGALTGREMCEIIYHFHRCVNLKPIRTPQQIWEIHPSGELYPVFDEFKLALFYFETEHDGKIIKHPLPETHGSEVKSE